MHNKKIKSYAEKSFKIFNKQKDQDPYSTKRLINKILGLSQEEEFSLRNPLPYRDHVSFLLNSPSYKTRKKRICRCKDCGNRFSMD